MQMIEECDNRIQSSKRMVNRLKSMDLYNIEKFNTNKIATYTAIKDRLLNYYVQLITKL